MKASHRATTSSRHPGRVFRGAVYREGFRVTPCEKCGGLRFAFMPGQAHAPHWQSRGDRFVLVDCLGDEVQP
ncbi:MAG: hypothetical protein AB1938_15710 [Myxococcota bacterium]